MVYDRGIQSAAFDEPVNPLGDVLGHFAVVATNDEVVDAVDDGGRFEEGVYRLPQKGRFGLETK